METGRRRKVQVSAITTCRETHGTYWAGNSVWVYSMSCFLHRRYVRGLLYVLNNLVQQIKQKRGEPKQKKESREEINKRVTTVTVPLLSD